MAFTEDMSTFFDSSEFATVVNIAGVDVDVIFDDGYQAALSGFIDSSAPSIVGPTVTLSSLLQGSAITVNSIAYKVASVHPDGTGVSTLILEKA